MKHLKTYQIFESDLKPDATRAPYRYGHETFPSKGKAYHVTPDIHLEEIQREGLEAKTENKLENHPERIYLFLNPASRHYKYLAAQLWNSSRDKGRIKDYYILEIDLKKLPGHKYFMDPASGISSWIGIYTEQSIPPSAIKIKEKIPVGILPKPDMSNKEDLKDEVYRKTGFWPKEKEEKKVDPTPPKKTPEEIKMERERAKERKKKRDAFFASMKGNLPKDGMLYLDPEMLETNGYVYEDYTDDEIKGLMGDLHSVGHHKLKFDVKEHPDSKYPGWVEGEKEAAESWTSKYNNNVFLTKVSGEMSNLDFEDVDLKFSNGDNANFMVRHDSDSGDKVLLTLNGSEYDVSDQYKKISPFNKTIMGTFLDIYDIIK